MNRLSELYFCPKKWEGRGSIYEILGVRSFKRLVTSLGRKTGQNSSKPNNYYLWKKNIDGIKAYERKTRYNEIMHLAGMLLPIIGLIRGGNSFTKQVVLWLILILNIHPYLLQRYNRLRIYRILGKLNRQ